MAAAPAQGTVQGAASLFVMGPDGVTKNIELKATRDSEGVKPVEGFELTVDNVVSTPLNGNLRVFGDVSVQFTGAKLTPAATVDTLDIPIIEGQINLVGISEGVYTLDVIVGDKAYECIVVIGPVAQQVIINEITEINSQSSNVVKIFEKGKEIPTPTPTPPPDEEPSICYFEPNDAPECEPVNGHCPNNWPMNEQGNCHPGGQCPEVDGVPFERVDDDESGTCYSSEDTFHCPGSGAIVLDEEDCAIYEPDALAANDTSSETQDDNDTSTEEEETEPITCEPNFILENGVCTEMSSNCGGEPCTPSQKEDSTTSDVIPGEPHTPTTESEQVVEEIEEQEEQDADQEEQQDSQSETEAEDEQPEQ
jgi:hypothetical protein